MYIIYTKVLHTLWRTKKKEKEQNETNDVIEITCTIKLV